MARRYNGSSFWTCWTTLPRNLTSPRVLRSDLNTRGEVKFRGKVVQQVQKDDPLYRRAIAETTAKTPPPMALQRTSYQPPATEAPAVPALPAQPPGPPGP